MRGRVCLLCWLAVRASVHSAQELEFTLRAKGLDILLKQSIGLCVAGVYSIVVCMLHGEIQAGTPA